MPLLKGKTHFRLCVLLLSATVTVADDRLAVRGYTKTFAVGYRAPAADVLRTEPEMWALSNRVRLQLSVRAADSLEIDAAYEVDARLFDAALVRSATGRDLAFNPEDYRLTDLDLQIFPASDNDPAAGSFGIYHNLDRLQAVWRAPQADVIIGRQALAWGNARVINPTDIIAPYSFNALDTEERYGVDAVRVRAPLGNLGELDLGYIPGRGFDFDRGAAFIRTRSYIWQTDIVLMLMAFRNHMLYGVDLTRAIGNAGFWLEAAFVDAGALRASDEVRDRDYFRASIGLDSRIARDTYGFIEYHFNSAGASDPDDYPTLAVDSAYRDGAVYLLGRHYLAAGLNFQWTPLVAVAASALCNLNDGSISLSPGLDYNVAENLYLGLGLSVSLGSTANSGTVPGTILYDSEFGAYASFAYASLRYYF
jgi:hypothetical protein